MGRTVGIICESVSVTDSLSRLTRDYSQLRNFALQIISDATVVLLGHHSICIMIIISVFVLCTCITVSDFISCALEFIMSIEGIFVTDAAA